MTEDDSEGEHHLLEATQLVAGGQESAIPSHQPGMEVPEPGASTAGLGLLAEVALELEKEGAGKVYVLEALEGDEERCPQVLPCLAQLREEADERLPHVEPLLAELFNLVKKTMK